MARSRPARSASPHLIVDDRDYPIASVCVTIAGNLVTGAQIDQIGAEVRRVALADLGRSGFGDAKS